VRLLWIKSNCQCLDTLRRAARIYTKSQLASRSKPDLRSEKARWWNIYAGEPAHRDSRRSRATKRGNTELTKTHTHYLAKRNGGRAIGGEDAY
jgi:hypothetical protein